MCYINYSFYEWDDQPDPTPRPFPRLAWATPVDIALLGANLEAYAKTEPQMTALRLSHRFGQGSLSTLPQELLEQIVEEAQKAERSETQSSWEEHLLCFQGRCPAGYHLPPGEPEFEEVWEGISWGSDIDPDDYSDEEKAKMVEDLLDYEPYSFDHDIIWERHDEAKPSWIKRVCVCDKNLKDTGPPYGFAHFNNILKNRFGLEVYVLHEVLSRDLEQFLCSTAYSEFEYHTSAYITLASGTFQEPASGSCGTASTNPLFASDGDHHACRQVIDPSLLVLSDRQRQRFARAMRLLGLSPHFQLPEIDKLIPPNTGVVKDSSLLEISKHHSPSLRSRERSKRLQQYIARRSSELAKQSWPQLMLLAASDAVCPF